MQFNFVKASKLLQPDGDLVISSNVPRLASGKVNAVECILYGISLSDPLLDEANYINWSPLV